MKKAISIFLIFIIILNSVFFGLIYLSLKIKLKSEFIERLSPNDKNIAVISYDKNIEDDKIQFLGENEIKIGEQFFDIIKTEIINDRKVIYCINDKDEINLDKAFSEFIASAIGAKTSQSSKIQTKTILLIALPVNIQEVSNIPYTKLAFIHNYYPIISAFIKIPTPPPKLYS